MCGIIGYISNNTGSNSINLGIEALKHLEYRGYDSAGIAYWNNKEKTVFSHKSVGRIVSLENKINISNPEFANPVILHTRWATHGEVTEENAHPHCDCLRNVWVVHNGIIENHRQLRQELEYEGHKFSSRTDSEVIAHLIEKYLSDNLEEAVEESLLHLEGSYGMAVISQSDPEKIVAARLSSPLLIGIGKDEYILASDPAAVVKHTRKVVYLDDNEIAVIRRNNYSIIREKQPVEI